MTDDQPQVSVILDASVPSATVSATVASVMAQAERRWELLLWCDAAQPAALAPALGDARVRLVDRSGSAATDMRRLREAVRGQYVAWIASGAVWPVSHLADALAGLRRTARDVHVGVTTGAMATTAGTSSEAAAALTALCVEEGAAVSSLVCTRPAFENDQPIGTPYTLCDTWARALRMVQRHLPVVSRADFEGGEREITLDLLPLMLCEMQRIHRLAGPLADTLPRARRNQWAMRESLWHTIGNGLTSLFDAYTRRALVSMMQQIADATLDFGQPADLQALRHLLDRAHDLGVRDLGLHHALLATERGLGHPMGVVQRYQSGGYPLDVVQASELVAAFRQLDNDAAAEQVIAVLDIDLPEPKPVAATTDATRRPDSAHHLNAPEWLVDLPVDVEQWHEAAEAYAVLGLTQSASVADELATHSGATQSMPTADSRRILRVGESLPWLDAIDQHLSRALTQRRTLLAPVVHPGRQRAIAGFIEPGARQLQDGAFERWVHELLLAPDTDPRVVPYLEHLERPHVFVDLDPGDGRRVIQALQVPHCHAVVARAPTALQAAQWQRAAGPLNRLQVVRDVDALCHATRRHPHLVLVHAPLAMASIADTMAVWEALSSGQRSVAMLWSGTDVPSLWSDSGVQHMLDVTHAVRLRTTALMWADRQFARLPLADAPRAHLLLTEATHVDA